MRTLTLKSVTIMTWWRGKEIQVAGSFTYRAIRNLKPSMPGHVLMETLPAMRIIF